MLKQVSIFAENTKGMFHSLTGILERENINILGSVTNDSAEYGIIRMVVSDPDLAVRALSSRDYLCRLTYVLGVELNDEVGALHHLLDDLLKGNININYLYLSFNRDSGMPVMVLHTDDAPEVEQFLKNKGYCLL